MVFSYLKVCSKHNIFCKIVKTCPILPYHQKKMKVVRATDSECSKRMWFLEIKEATS